jgi:phosphoribosylanthranilate isomerase
MLPVKICGLTCLDDAALAWELGASALGFIFHPASPRYITPDEAARIRRQLPRGAYTVGVFVNEDPDRVNTVAGLVGLDAVQLHGTEGPDTCRAIRVPVIKTLRAEDAGRLDDFAAGRPAAFLMDTSDPVLLGGTGRPADWNVARRLAGQTRLILAGGLSPANILQAAASVHPDGLDVNSGVESAPGRKDPARLRALFDLLPWKGERPCLLP